MTPFTPIPEASRTLAVTTSSQRTPIGLSPITGPFQLRIENPGAAEVFVEVGDPAVTAGPSSLGVPPGAVEVVTVRNRDDRPSTHFDAVTATGAGLIRVTPGYGI